MLVWFQILLSKKRHVTFWSNNPTMSAGFQPLPMLPPKSHIMDNNNYHHHSHPSLSVSQHIPKSPKLIHNSNPTTSAASVNYSMLPPPVPIPGHMSGQHSHQQHSPSLVNTHNTTGSYHRPYQPQQNVFQFSDVHFGMHDSEKMANLAHSTPNQSPINLSQYNKTNTNPNESKASVTMVSMPSERGPDPMLVVSSSYQDVQSSPPSSSSPASSSHSLSSVQVVRLQTPDTMLSAINYNENEMLHDNSFDVPGMDENLLNTMPAATTLNPTTSSAFDLFDSGNIPDYSMDGQQDLQLSPQSFTDPSNSFGLSESSTGLSLDGQRSPAGKAHCFDLFACVVTSLHH